MSIKEQNEVLTALCIAVGAIYDTKPIIEMLLTKYELVKRPKENKK